MKTKFPFLVLFAGLALCAHAQRLIDNVTLGGNSTVAAGSTLVAAANSTVDLHAATVTFASGQLGWSLLSGTPTTLAGYGITDAATAANLTTEVSRAEAAEGTLTTNLSTETTRAETAEGNLTTALTTKLPNDSGAITTDGSGDITATSYTGAGDNITLPGSFSNTVVTLDQILNSGSQGNGGIAFFLDDQYTTTPTGSISVVGYAYGDILAPDDTGIAGFASPNLEAWMDDSGFSGLGDNITTTGMTGTPVALNQIFSQGPGYTGGITFFQPPSGAFAGSIGPSYYSGSTGWAMIPDGDYLCAWASPDGTEWFDNTGFNGYLVNPDTGTGGISGPPNATDPGVPGQMYFTDTYTYRCFASGDWRRTAVTYTTY